MFSTTAQNHIKYAWKKKAKTNIYIATELADSFGGRKADYLKRLNRRLRIKIAMEYMQPLAKAA
jgi:hypothetical protein